MVGTLSPDVTGRIEIPLIGVLSAAFLFLGVFWLTFGAMQRRVGPEKRLGLIRLGVGLETIGLILWVTMGRLPRMDQDLRMNILIIGLVPSAMLGVVIGILLDRRYRPPEDTP